MENIPGTSDFDTYHKGMKRNGESNWATGSTPGGAIPLIAQYLIVDEKRHKNA